MSNTLNYLRASKSRNIYIMYMVKERKYLSCSCHVSKKNASIM